ncbi:MAG: S41 family peptidase [Candidatus Amoebophilus sp.]
MWKYKRILPDKNFILGMCVGIGLCLYVGLYFFQDSFKQPVRKFGKVLNYIQKYHIDTIDNAKLTELTDAALAKLAKQLDPHTTYIDAQQNSINKHHLKSHIEGVGIEFILLKDVVYVLHVIPKGPADQAGLQAGDKVIKIDDHILKEANFSLNDIVSKMRGPKGTPVKVYICRNNTKDLIEVTIIRDQISIPSIDAGYMVDDQTGYIKLSQFASKTYQEFIESTNQLSEQGMKRLLLDLRDNSGGYLGTALDIAEEMLEPGKLILYTKGKYKDFDTKYYANGKNRLGKLPIIILINENTASASELLAGALQDHDRALIVGRRSFGKGLVQWPIEFKDSSVLNLTVERYFTPSGRFVQKPYDKRINYELDLYNRYKQGEYFHADSIQLDKTLAYQTSAGRTVYGGGGIMPDHFIPLDTTAHSDYVNELVDNYIIQQYAITYARSNKQKLEKLRLEGYLKNFCVTEEMVNQLVEEAKKAAIKQVFITDQIKISIKNLLKAYIAKTLWQYQGFYSVYNQTDTTISKSLKLFNQAEALLQEDITYIAG